MKNIGSYVGSKELRASEQDMVVGASIIRSLRLTHAAMPTSVTFSLLQHPSLSYQKLRHFLDLLYRWRGCAVEPISHTQSKEGRRRHDFSRGSYLLVLSNEGEGKES